MWVLGGNYKKACSSNKILAKPNADGCSTCVVVLRNAQDLSTYCHQVVEDTGLVRDVIFEPFWETDAVIVNQKSVVQRHVSGWVELTVGVYEVHGQLCAMTPSITVADGDVLSLEEKFQGGTGVNLTPPPGHIIDAGALTQLKQKVQHLAQQLGVRGYARLDIFYSTNNQEIILIEVNALPGLTPSTVLYHQALLEEPSMQPHMFLDHIIRDAYGRK